MLNSCSEHSAASQLAFDFDQLGPIQAPDYPDDANHDERFEAFHAANPHIYLAIVSLARNCKHEGWQRIGMKMIFEQLRWKFAQNTRGSKYKLNNNHTAHYARLVMQRNQTWLDFLKPENKETHMAKKRVHRKAPNDADDESDEG